MGPGTVGYKRLKALIMEPRCWKLLIEHFPGAEALRDPSQPPSSYLQAQQAASERAETPYERYLPRPRPADVAAAGATLVMDQPIMSPRAGNLRVSEQPQESLTSWGDNSVVVSMARSIERSLRSRASRDPEEEGGANIGAPQRRDRAQDRRTARRVEHVDSDLSSDGSEEFGNITSFRQVGRLFKQMQAKHDKAENSLKLRG